ncbi:MAG: ThiF family adenylyltransferase [Planctomycetes bacterium]|nr:ThiF family adenylyltransferase [Planctomycetota bacterium]
MHAWYTRHPQWFAAELAALKRNYPKFVLDEGSLLNGHVSVYGELVIRPQGGAKRFPVRVDFPSNSPYAFPVVTPLESMPTFDGNNAAISFPKARMFDHRHQMPAGSLCLFQYETRTTEGGEAISVIDVLNRAEAWFLGHITGRWPPDSKETELQAHFYRVGFGILLGKTFYSELLKGNGEFFAVKDVHRFYVGRSQEEPPLIATSATVLTSVYQVVDSREDLQAIFPWISNDAWEPKKFVECQERQRQHKSIDFGDIARVNGYWWELGEEPCVFRDGKGLLGVLSSVAPNGDAWSMVSKSIGVDFTLKNMHHIGLCYPGRFGEREWLFVVVLAGAEKSNGLPAVLTDDQKRARFESARVACVPVHGMTPNEIGKRNETVVAPQIASKRVALVGLGALGSKVGEMLAQAGVSQFKLCDGDILHVGNVARHVGGLRDSGSPKTEVVANRIWDVNPYARITVFDKYINSPSQEEVRELFADVDLIVCTIADEGAESGFNDLAVDMGIPVIYGRSMRRGQMGRVFVVRPGVDACKTCLGMIAYQDTPDWISVPERTEDALLHECGRPVIAGSAVDLVFVSGYIARTAIDFLESNSALKNHLVWTLRAMEEFDGKLNSPFSIVQSNFEPQPGCPSCGPARISSISLPSTVRDFIFTEVALSPTAETGGILIGKIDGGTAIVIRATGPGPKAVRTATRFERDVEFAQQELDAESSKDASMVYIGEWHSHLVANPVPSGMDVLSLTGIAQSSNYTTNCPIMLICGFDPEKMTVGELKGWVFPIESSMRNVTVIIEGAAT